MTWIIYFNYSFIISAFMASNKKEIICFYNMISKFRFLILFSLSILGCLGVSVLPVCALGISPTPIVRDNVANGVKMEEHVKIMRSDIIGNAIIEVNLFGEAARYLQFDKKTLIIPEGQTEIDYTFYIAPQGAQNGRHEGFVTFVRKATDYGKKFAGSGASVQEAISARVIFTIVDHEVKTFQISDVKFEDTELGLPIIFSFFLRNSGNVDIRPDRVELTMVDITDQTSVFKKTYEQKDIEVIPPGGQKAFSLTMDQKMPQGQYDASAVFYMNNVVVYRADHKTLRILPPGSLGQGADFTTFSSDKPNYSENELSEITGVLKNTGSIALNTAFVAEVYKDGKRLDILRSKDKIVLKGQQGHYTNDYRFQNYGEYKLKGYFEYGSNKTPYKELTIQVLAPSGVNNSMRLVIIIIFVIAILLVCGILVVRHSRHRFKKAKKMETVKLLKLKKRKINK